MGKKIVPPHDPERLARIMDERQRQIGVDLNELERQVAVRRERETASALEDRAIADEQLRWASLVVQNHEEAEKARRHAAMATAERQTQQAAEKQRRDAELTELLRNKLDPDKYFGQFGVSHR